MTGLLENLDEGIGLKWFSSIHAMKSFLNLSIQTDMQHKYDKRINNKGNQTMLQYPCIAQMVVDCNEKYIR